MGKGKTFSTRTHAEVKSSSAPSVIRKWPIIQLFQGMARKELQSILGGRDLDFEWSPSVIPGLEEGEERPAYAANKKKKKKEKKKTFMRERRPPEREGREVGATTSERRVHSSGAKFGATKFGRQGFLSGTTTT